MSKNHRGAGIRSLEGHGRGVCPVCHRTGVKVLYEVDVDGKKVKVCKVCNAVMKNKARKEAHTASPVVSDGEATGGEAGATD